MVMTGKTTYVPVTQFPKKLLIYLYSTAQVAKSQTQYTQEPPGQFIRLGEPIQSSTNTRIIKTCAVPNTAWINMESDMESELDAVLAHHQSVNDSINAATRLLQSLRINMFGVPYLLASIVRNNLNGKEQWDSITYERIRTLWKSIRSPLHAWMSRYVPYGNANYGQQDADLVWKHWGSPDVWKSRSVSNWNPVTVHVHNATSPLAIHVSHLRHWATICNTIPNTVATIGDIQTYCDSNKGCTSVHITSAYRHVVSPISTTTPELEYRQQSADPGHFWMAVRDIGASLVDMTGNPNKRLRGGRMPLSILSTYNYKDGQLHGYNVLLALPMRPSSTENANIMNPCQALVVDVLLPVLGILTAPPNQNCSRIIDFWNSVLRAMKKRQTMSAENAMEIVQVLKMLWATKRDYGYALEWALAEAHKHLVFPTYQTYFQMLGLDHASKEKGVASNVCLNKESNCESSKRTVESESQPLSMEIMNYPRIPLPEVPERVRRRRAIFGKEEEIQLYRFCLVPEVCDYREMWQMYPASQIYKTEMAKRKAKQEESQLADKLVLWLDKIEEIAEIIRPKTNWRRTVNTVKTVYHVAKPVAMYVAPIIYRKVFPVQQLPERLDRNQQSPNLIVSADC